MLTVLPSQREGKGAHSDYLFNTALGFRVNGRQNDDTDAKGLIRTQEVEVFLFHDRVIHT